MGGGISPPLPCDCSSPVPPVRLHPARCAQACPGRGHPGTGTDRSHIHRPTNQAKAYANTCAIHAQHMHNTGRAARRVESSDGPLLWCWRSETWRSATRFGGRIILQAVKHCHPSKWRKQTGAIYTPIFRFCLAWGSCELALRLAPARPPGGRAEPAMPFFGTTICRWMRCPRPAADTVPVSTKVLRPTRAAGGSDHRARRGTRLRTLPCIGR